MAAALVRSGAAAPEGPVMAEFDAADFADTESYDSESDSDIEVVEEQEVSKKVPKMQGSKWMLTGRPCNGMNWDAFCVAVRGWSKCRYAACQLEISANGKEHIQMYLQTKATVTAVAISKKFAEFVRSWHFIRQSERGGTNAECAAYCMKEDTRKEGCEPFQCGEMVKGRGARTDIKTAVTAAFAGRPVYELINEEEKLLRLRSHLLAHARDGAALRREQEAIATAPEAYDWQRECVSHLLGQGDRKITWLWDPRGAAGKTALVSILRKELGRDVCLLRGGKAADLIHAWVNAGCPGHVVFDLARTRGHITHLCGLMENLKDGNVVSTKYDSRDIPCRSVKVLVLSNSPPPAAETGGHVWTGDRYDLRSVQRGEGGVVTPEAGAPWTTNQRAGLHFVPVTCEVGSWYPQEGAFQAHS